MSLKISDLMHILKYFEDLKSLKKDTLFFQLHYDTVETMVNWSQTYDLGIKLNYLNEKNNIVKITPKGKIFHSMSNNF